MSVSCVKHDIPFCENHAWIKQKGRKWSIKRKRRQLHDFRRELRMHKECTKNSVRSIISYLVSHASSRKLLVKKKSMIFVYRGICIHKKKKFYWRIRYKQENDIHTIKYCENRWGKRSNLPWLLLEKHVGNAWYNVYDHLRRI